MALHLNKLESPSPKDALCQVRLKLAQWFRRRRFLNFVNVFSLFRNYLPLEKGGALHLNKLESPSPKFGWWFWRRRWKCEKFTTTQQRRRQRLTMDKALLSLWVRWAKNQIHPNWASRSNKLPNACISEHIDIKSATKPVLLGLILDTPLYMYFVKLYLHTALPLTP